MNLSKKFFCLLSAMTEPVSFESASGEQMLLDRELIAKGLKRLIQLLNGTIALLIK